MAMKYRVTVVLEEIDEESDTYRTAYEMEAGSFNTRNTADKLVSAIDDFLMEVEF